MKDYSRLFSDILFYTKELEMAEAQLKSVQESTEGGNALLRARREYEKIKSKLDSLCEEIPEERG